MCRLHAGSTISPVVLGDPLTCGQSPRRRTLQWGFLLGTQVQSIAAERYTTDSAWAEQPDRVCQKKSRKFASIAGMSRGMLRAMTRAYWFNGRTQKSLCGPDLEHSVIKGPVRNTKQRGSDSTARVSIRSRPALGGLSLSSQPGLEQRERTTPS